MPAPSTLPLVTSPPRAPLATQRSSFSPHMILLERASGPGLPAWAAPSVAAAMHGSLLAHARSPAPTLLSGHDPLGAPAQRDHLAIVPLPDIGHTHARGELLGLALVHPRDVSSEALRTLHEAIAAWNREGATLRLGRWGCWRLSPSLLAPRHRDLRAHAWCRPSARWASATPLVLDRFPGPLHDPRPHHRARAQTRARASITAACLRIGLPAPVDIELHDSPVLGGSMAARRFPSYPERGPARVRVHVRLRFADAVEGPMLLGAGRYRGLGLMRSLG